MSGRWQQLGVRERSSDGQAEAVLALRIRHPRAKSRPNCAKILIVTAHLFELHLKQSAWRFVLSSCPVFYDEDAVFAAFGRVWSTSIALSSAEMPQSSQLRHFAQEWEYVPALIGKTTIPSFETRHPGPCAGAAIFPTITRSKRASRLERQHRSYHLHSPNSIREASRQGHGEGQSDRWSRISAGYWVSFPEGYRAHQIRLEGGDRSTDSFCYPSVWAYLPRTGHLPHFGLRLSWVAFITD